MLSGRYIQSGRWSDVIDLYNDGEYSAIWGKFVNPFARCLGVRWNDVFGTAGYPCHGSHPIWYAEPPWTTKMILLELCNRVVKNPKHGNMENILTALKECPEEKVPDTVVTGAEIWRANHGTVWQSQNARVQNFTS